MRVETNNLERAFQKVPEEDFVNARYDAEDSPHETKRILVIFSTPRSGSTLLCDYIRQAGLCVPHEYFQSTDYMPILGHRWGCIQGSQLDLDQYFAALLKYRTSRDGWLGINVHGSHLNVFMKFFRSYPDFVYHFIHLERKNSVAQAISYEIASQTRGWSAYFDKTGAPSYHFDAILDKLDRIEDQNTVIRCFLAGKQCYSLFYEDFSINPEQEISRVGLPEKTGISLFKPSLKKQNDSTNQSWIERFNNDFQTSFIKRQLPQKVRPPQQKGHFSASLISKCRGMTKRMRSIARRLRRKPLNSTRHS